MGKQKNWLIAETGEIFVFVISFIEKIKEKFLVGYCQNGLISLKYFLIR